MGYLPYVPALVTGRQGNGETGVPEMVCGTGTTQNDGIVVYLPAFRGCRAGLQGRYYTERPNHGVPALCTCLGDGETGVPEMVCGTGTTQNDGIVVYLPSFRDCKTGLQGRYYTERPNHGVPALGTCLGNRATGRQGRQNEIRWQGVEGRVT